PFNGTLAWVSREDVSWQAAPPSVPFALAPGQEMSVRFLLSPTGRKGAPPIFEVRAHDLGVARQPLIFTPLKSINLPLVDSPCRIDGSFENEPFWNTAAKLEDFTVTATDAKPSHVILCRLAANAEGILVAIRCEAEKPAKIPCKIAGRDGPVYEDESVEVFIDPTAQGKEYLQFSVNLSGAFLDRSSHFGLAWNPPWQQAIKFADNYYDVEILIPYRSLGLSAKPRPGDRLGINICRNDYRIKPPKKKKEESVSASADKSASAGLEVVQWAQTMGNNGRPGCYGQATFVLPGQAPAAGR
ncbi:MAG: hypothetical protein N3A66_10750, partial [Planctomycetota bacterium]|nr:hypothetical protein [Planctomycetota bacterium]